MKVYEGKLVSDKQRYGIIVGRFNEFIGGKLLGGALDALKRHGASEDQVEIAWVPGAFEIPLIAKKMASSGRYDAVYLFGRQVITGFHYRTLTTSQAKSPRALRMCLWIQRFQ